MGENELRQGFILKNNFQEASQGHYVFSPMPPPQWRARAAEDALVKKATPGLLEGTRGASHLAHDPGSPHTSRKGSQVPWEATAHALPQRFRQHPLC